MTGCDRWREAVRVAALFAIAPVGSGIWLRSSASEVRRRWLEGLGELLPQGVPFRRAPCSVSDGDLLGGLDLAATLAAGRPMARRGIVASADRGVLVAAMVERLQTGPCAVIAQALDTGMVDVERDGMGFRAPARFGVVALDEGEGEETPAPALTERLVFHLDLDGMPLRDCPKAQVTRTDVAAARARLARVGMADSLVRELCAAAGDLGIASLRPPLWSAGVARQIAALDGRYEVTREDAVEAARLVLVPKARRLPEQQSSDPAPDERETPTASEGAGDPAADQLLDAVLAALPPGLLALLAARNGRREGGAGKSGTFRGNGVRGRPVGTLPGDPRSARVDLVATLRAAAPWQKLRGRASDRIQVRPGDLRIRRFEQRTQTTVAFVVDASGSAALHRMGEAKGAVELMLSDCYSRRDEVALLAFRGKSAELLLPPTRALSRARRCLAALPAGGGTPLATGIDASFALVEELRRKGRTPIVAFLTDGRANVARCGAQGRQKAEADALHAARRLRGAGAAVHLIDTSPRPEPQALRIAEAMGARYLPLPHADARTLSQAIRPANG